MQPTDLYSVSCALPRESVDTLLELLDCDDFTPTFRENVEMGEAFLEVFLEDEKQVPEVVEAIRNAAEAAECPVEPKIGRVAASDWAESWKRFFHVMRISKRFVVRPSWETYEAEPADCVITLDPGMSFGTGQHATTQACLQLLDELAGENLDRSVLDMGCGSGILAIGAKKLGFTDVKGFDYDPDAVAVALENADFNGVRIPFYEGDLSKCEEQADVVLANILGPVLIEFAPNIAKAVKPGGDLVISGILATIYEDVREAFVKQGFSEVKNVLIGEWRSGWLKK